MRNLSKIIATAALSAGLAIAAAPAHAVTVIPISTGPFDSGNPSGVIPAGVLADQQAADNPYDFTFTTVGKVYQTLMQMQATNLSGHPQVIAFQLFSGTPGSGTFIANSGGTTTAATLRTLTAGSYYLEVDKVNAPEELITGGLTLLNAVPEPATWAMMLIGFGVLGAAVRRRRSIVGVAA